MREGRLKLFCTTGPSFGAILVFDMLCEGSTFKANGMFVMRW